MPNRDLFRLFEQFVELAIQQLPMILLGGERFLESLFATAGCALRFGHLGSEILDGRGLYRLLVRDHTPGIRGRSSASTGSEKDGRWEAAYDSPASAEVPEDLAAALKRNAKAKAFFATLNSANRYAILWRIQTAKKAETRARRITEYVAMLERHEKFHP